MKGKASLSISLGGEAGAKQNKAEEIWGQWWSFRRVTENHQERELTRLSTVLKAHLRLETTKIEAKIHTIICIFPIVSCRSRHIHWLDWSKCQGLQDQWNKKTMGHSGADWTSTKAAEESVTGEGEWDRLKHEKDQTKLSLDSKYSGCRMNNTTEED